MKKNFFQFPFFLFHFPLNITFFQWKPIILHENLYISQFFPFRSPFNGVRFAGFLACLNVIGTISTSFFPFFSSFFSFFSESEADESLELCESSFRPAGSRSCSGKCENVIRKLLRILSPSWLLGRFSRLQKFKKMKKNFFSWKQKKKLFTDFLKFQKKKFKKHNHRFVFFNSNKSIYNFAW